MSDAPDVPVKFHAVRRIGAEPEEYLATDGTWTTWFGNAAVLSGPTVDRFDVPADGELFDWVPGDIEGAGMTFTTVEVGSRAPALAAAKPNRSQRRADAARRRRQERHSR